MGARRLGWGEGGAHIYITKFQYKLVPTPRVLTPIHHLKKSMKYHYFY